MRRSDREGRGPTSAQPQVLVVGAGPAGLVLAITLARCGVGVLLLEKRERTSNLARALVISTRSMEIFRSVEREVRGEPSGPGAG